MFSLRDARGLDEVQVDTHPDGQPPFYLEGDVRGPVESADVAEAAGIVRAWLQGRPSPA